MKVRWPIRTLDAIAAARPATAWILGLMLLALVAAVDWACPAEIAASHLYLLPVAFAAWAQRHPGALVLGTLATVVWLLVDLGTHVEAIVPLLETANALALLVAFTLFGSLVAVLRERVDRLRRLATTDPLTGIHNRRAFRSAVQREILRCRREGSTFALAYLDLDGFKAVNDQYGHDAGDTVLREVARTMATSVRELDMVARMGGDEFAVLLPGSDPFGARTVIQRLRDELVRLDLPGGSHVDFCLGCLAVESSPPDVDSLISRADQVMYQLKAEGTGRVRHEVLRRKETSRDSLARRGA